MNYFIYTYIVSMLLSNKAPIFVCSNCLFFFNMVGLEQGNVSDKEFMEEVARYECVYHLNSKDLKDKNKKANSCEKSAKNLVIGGGGGGQIPQHKNCIWLLSEAIENATIWIRARCSSKRISKSGMAQSTYITQTIKHKAEIKVTS